MPALHLAAPGLAAEERLCGSHHQLIMMLNWQCCPEESLHSYIATSGTQLLPYLP